VTVRSVLGKEMIQVRDAFQGPINKSISSEDRVLEQLYNI
jgi:hypothetical protein